MKTYDGPQQSSEDGSSSSQSDEKLSIWTSEDELMLPHRSKRLQQCSCWIKYCLFVINFFVTVGGICCVIVGTWAHMEKLKLGSFDNLITDPAFFLLFVGFIMVIIGVPGCLGPIRENICLLKMFCLVTVIIFAVLLACGISAYFFLEYVRGHLLKQTITALLNYEEAEEHRNSLDYVQSQFECCGGDSYNDWNLNIYYNCSSPARGSCGVPISCCKVPYSLACGYKTRIYSSEGDNYAAHTIFTRGCVDAMMLIFKDHLIVIGLIAFGVGFVELFSILLAHSLAKEILLTHKIQREIILLSSDTHKMYNSTSAQPR